MSRVSALLLAAPLLAIGCGTLLPSSGADETVVARIGDGEVITLAELDASVAQPLYDLRKKALEGLITQRAVALRARKLGADTEALMQGVVAGVSDAEVAAFFEQRKEAILQQIPDATLESVGPQIRAGLANERKRDFVKAIVAGTPHEILLSQPRVEVSVEGRPSLGPADAGVTIVEFSDFQCPYCRRAGPILKELLAKYPEDVRLVYRHLPLPNHSRARHSAEAAACADEQGRFWDYHDLVFENPTALGDADLMGYAAKLELEPQDFEACYGERRTARLVREDALAANLAGISSTPAFVVNGRVFTGLRSLEAFEELVREELGLAGAAPPEPAAGTEAEGDSEGG